ncbi:MAG: tellurite resistance TerB C-terminal domain-containing protein [Chryseobacterium taeanense]
MDKSIIDITGQSFTLDSNSIKSNVPYWQHQYVYSFSEINTASNDQRRFYKTFKVNFLNEIYMDIEDNTNYAFILLFDLLNEYDNHQDLARLEKQLKLMGQYYPKTKSYCIAFIIKKLEADGKSIEAERIKKEENYYTYDDNYWKLGTRYKIKLNLNNDDTIILNKLSNPNNNFFNIEFCGLEVVKLYLVAIKRLDEKYQKESSSLEDELNKIADIIARKHFNYRKGSGNYKYSLETIVSELHANIFKYCENTVREHYVHKRKLSTDIPYTFVELNDEYHNKLIIRLLKALAIYAPTLSAPDRNAELELNAQNSGRWKIKFDELTDNYVGDHKQFVSDIVILGNLNKRNPAVENIFYEASRFIAHHDKISALKLYMYYLHYDLKSVKFDNKPLAKTVLKSLFTTNEQLHDFQIIVSEMIKDKELGKALNAVPKVYATKRKKIQIDRDIIQQVHEKHSDTVELLNEYLKDEYEDEENTFKTEEISADEMIMEITSKSVSEEMSIFNTGISLTQIQCEILEIFVKSNLSVSHHDIESFTRSKGVFKNQLIESLNEACYETLDDVLIEEDEEYYTINENYYQTILAK